MSTSQSHMVRWLCWLSIRSLFFSVLFIFIFFSFLSFLFLFLLFLCQLDMSFFGFDTTLPKDRPSRVSRGIFENPDPFAEVARARAEGLHDGDNDA
jgi:hypothetical protein